MRLWRGGSSCLALLKAADVTKLQKADTFAMVLNLPCSTAPFRDTCPAGIPKLEDANDAGGRSSEHCTLILTEGDSAKSLAVAGLSVVGRDRFGVFPLRCAQGGVQ